MNETDIREYLEALGLTKNEVDRMMREMDVDVVRQVMDEGDADVARETLEGQVRVIIPATTGSVRPDVQEVLDTSSSQREAKRRAAANVEKREQEETERAVVTYRQVGDEETAAALESGEMTLAEAMALRLEDEEIVLDPFVTNAMQNWGLDPTDPANEEKFTDALSVWAGIEWDGPLTQEFWDEFAKLPGQLKNQIVLDAAGKAAEMSAIYPTANGGRLVLDREEAAIMGRFPELRRHFGRIVQATDTSGVPEAVLASLFSSLGVFDRATRASLQAGPAEAEGPVEPILARATEEDPEGVARAARAARTATDDQRSLWQRASLDYLGDRIQRLQQEFGDWTVAFVAMHDENLARKMYSDPYSLTSEQRNKLGQIMVGWDPQMLADSGVFINKAKYDFANGLAAGPGGDGQGGGTVDIPDPRALDESMLTLYRTWFQQEPTPEDLAAFTSSINGEVRARVNIERGNPFQDSWAAPQVTEQIAVSPEAAAIAYMRGRPEYIHLFQNKPAGLSEEQYVGQFQAGVQSILGAEQSPEAVRAGMAGGSLQTSVGQAFFAGVGRPEEEASSTLEGRMARAARVMRPLL